MNQFLHHRDFGWKHQVLFWEILNLCPQKKLDIESSMIVDSDEKDDVENKSKESRKAVQVQYMF